MATAQEAADGSPVPTGASGMMDASGMVAAATWASDTLRRLIAAADLVPDNLARTAAWVGTPREWLALAACSLVLVAVAQAARRLVERLVAPEHGFRGWFLGSASFVAAGVLVHLAFPVADRVRAVSLVVVLSVGFVVLNAALAGLALRRGGVAADRTTAALVTAELTVTAVGYTTLGLMRLAGTPVDARLFLGMCLWLVLMAGAVALLARFRTLEHGSTSIASSDPASGHDPIHHLLSRRAEWFFGSVLFLIAAATIVSALREGPAAFLSGALALLALGALPATMALLPLPTIGSEGTVRPWRATVRRCARLGLFIAFWLVLARLLDVHLVEMASDRLGEGVARVMIDVAVAVALGSLLWQVAEAALDGLAAGRATGIVPPDTDAHAGRHASRIETFVPLLRTIAAALIVTVTGMVVLASMGVHIGPLLAGAGIFGIAVGFGSQALVKDVISGLFFLADDAFRIGEYIEVGSAKGTVESLSIRSMKLRHSRGAIYTVPFGQIGVVNNQSRDWAIVKLEFLVDFDTDLREAKRLVRGIGAEIAADEEIGKSLLDPVKFQGVRRMEPYGMVVGVKFTAVPGEQFALQREVYARVRDAFAGAGIRFARPRVSVDAGGRHLTDEAIGAAVATSLPPPAKDGRDTVSET
ncbi:mechanosensitive ion channel family protein [Aureimonas leprariae]|uniref:Mechanosensitive ion channel family protein n=1 Tax=Plantimonas leprariae TaxID=2615207 RepID=A0A7V7TW03_9HYPH|nr:mechanosensitive ion channel family protein [Aureimonas leprariae]KAB0679057.1 mechanosensitive ion channel family protein [Aureimonas leprariae]